MPKRKGRLNHKRQLWAVERLLVEEMKKPPAVRDQAFINECFETIEYLQKQAEALQRPFGNPWAGRRFRYAAAALTAFFVLLGGSAITNARGANLWNIIFRQNRPQTQMDFVQQSDSASGIAENAFDLSYETKQYLDFTKVCAQCFLATPPRRLQQGLTFQEALFNIVSGEGIVMVYYANSDGQYVLFNTHLFTDGSATITMGGLKEAQEQGIIVTDGVEVTWQKNADVQFAAWQTGYMLYSIETNLTDASVLEIADQFFL